MTFLELPTITSFEDKHSDICSTNIMFVLDCTGSMAQELVVIEDSIRDFFWTIKSKSFGKQIRKTNFGLVEFRDRLYGEEHRVVTFEGEPFTEDLGLFHREVSKLQAEGGGDEPESSLDAILLALRQFPKTGYNNNVIILVTDAAPHVPDVEAQSIEQVAQAVRDAGVQLYIVTRTQKSFGRSDFKLPRLYQVDSQIYYKLLEGTQGKVFELDYGKDFLFSCPEILKRRLLDIAMNINLEGVSESYQRGYEDGKASRSSSLISLPLGYYFGIEISHYWRGYRDGRDWHNQSTNNDNDLHNRHNSNLNNTRNLLQELHNSVSDLVYSFPETFETQDIKSCLSCLEKFLSQSAPMSISVIGTFKRGKSLFMSGLIGQKIAPIRASEMSNGVLTFQDSLKQRLILTEKEEAIWGTGEWTQLSDEDLYQRICTVIHSYHDVHKNREYVASLSFRNDLFVFPIFTRGSEISLKGYFSYFVADSPWSLDFERGYNQGYEDSRKYYFSNFAIKLLFKSIKYLRAYLCGYSEGRNVRWLLWKYPLIVSSKFCDYWRSFICNVLEAEPEEDLHNKPRKTLGTLRSNIRFENDLHYATKELLDALPKLWSHGVLYALVFFAALGIPWATVSKIDETGSAKGRIEPKGATQKLDSLAAGSVKFVNVKEGDTVKAGQTLLELDAGILKTELQQAEAKLTGFLNQRAQLDVIKNQIQLTLSAQEQQNQFQALEKLSQINQAKHNLAAKTSVFYLQRLERQALVNQVNQQILAVLNDKNASEKRLTIDSRQVERFSNLMGEGAVSINQIDELLKQQQENKRLYERAKSDVKQSKLRLTEEKSRFQATMNQLEADIEQAKLQLQEEKNSYNSLLQAGKLSILKHQEQLKDIDNQATALESQIAQTKGQIASLNIQLKQRIVRSPIDGVIFELPFSKAGQVVQPGQRIAQIAPRNADVVLKAQMPIQYSGFLKVGMTVKNKNYKKRTTQFLANMKYKFCSKLFWCEPRIKKRQSQVYFL